MTPLPAFPAHAIMTTTMSMDVRMCEGIVAIGAMQNVQTRCAGNAKMEHTCGKEGDPYK